MLFMLEPHFGLKMALPIIVVRGICFFEVSGQINQNDESWGFQPTGAIPGEKSNYFKIDASISFEINDAQAQKIRDFAEKNVENHTDNFGGWSPWNSCVDFTWKALNEAGINSSSMIWKEGRFYPKDDVDNLKSSMEKYMDKNRGIRDCRRQCLIDPRTNDFYNQSKNWRPAPVDPLIFDLDNDGIETVGLNAAKSILFDSNGDGVKTATGWAGKDDGLLVWDRNGNGQIDSGRELFGDASIKTNGERARDGLDALADLDSNGDGVISALDALWNELKIWQDANQDGISQAHELKSLNEQGFQEIKLTPTGGAQTQANGNQITSSAGYTKTDGTSGTYGNLSLASNDFYREFTDKIALTETAHTLADMQGAGAVRDLREAF